MNARLPHISVFVFIVTWARFCFFLCFQKTWEERGKEWEGLEAFFHEGVREGAEERSDHVQ